MQRRLFICGDGAFELFFGILGEHLAEAGGYYTRSVCTSDGSPVGEELLPSAAAAGIEGYTGARYLDYAGGKLQKDNEVFRTEAVRLLQEAEYYPFALLGELGGFELVIPQYRAQLAAFLSSSVPCLGIIKPLSDSLMLGQLFGLGERYGALVRQLRHALEEDPDTVLLELQEETLPAVTEAIENWKQEYLK